MNDKRHNDLMASIREGGRVVRHEELPSRNWKYGKCESAQDRMWREMYEQAKKTVDAVKKMGTW